MDRLNSLYFILVVCSGCLVIKMVCKAYRERKCKNAELVDLLKSTRYKSSIDNSSINGDTLFQNCDLVLVHIGRSTVKGKYKNTTKYIREWNGCTTVGSTIGVILISYEPNTKSAMELCGETVGKCIVLPPNSPESEKLDDLRGSTSIPFNYVVNASGFIVHRTSCFDSVPTSAQVTKWCQMREHVGSTGYRSHCSIM